MTCVVLEGRDSYVSSAGETVLRLLFFAGAGASSSDFTTSDTFCAIFLTGDLVLLPRRL